jgi:uncharacterized membrane protein YfcA
MTLALLAIVAASAVANLVGIGNWTAVGFPLAAVAVSLMHLFTTSSEPVEARAVRHRPDPAQLVALVATSGTAVATSVVGARQLHETFTWVLTSGVVSIFVVVLIRTFTSPSRKVSTQGRPLSP